jgi:F-type H+-transporting ATPase subunit a
MTLGEKIAEHMEFRTVFTIPAGPLEIGGHTFFQNGIPITETVVISWIVMVILIASSIIFTRKLKTVPAGAQIFLEYAVEFKNKFAKEYFGRYHKAAGDYIGTLFLFLLVANIIPFLTPVSFYGREPLFVLKPPTRDINVTAACAVVSLFLILALGIHSRGIKGWAKNLFEPSPIMFPFNLMDFITRPLALALRLFGNILGGFIIMFLLEQAVPIALPMAASLYFDFFDGFLQALVFCFLTAVFVHEAVQHAE